MLGPSLVDQQQSLRDQFPSDPFNQYNTDFVRLDASGQPLPYEPNQSVSTWIGPAQFSLLTPDNPEEEQLMNNEDSSAQQEPTISNAMSVAADSINNKSLTDVTFIVGPAQHSKKYVGHRVLLAMTSPVFETMFYGDMADKNKYIRITDVAPIGFENLLRYAYTDSLSLASVEDAMLTAYAAKKYLLPQLLCDCLNYIEQNICPSTVCVVFEFAQVLNSQQLVFQAMKMMDRQTRSVLAAKSFSNVQPTTVEFLANRKYLNLAPDGECQLLTALLTWAQSELKRRGLDSSDWLQMRSLMGEHSILNAIRFLSMTPEQFVRCLAESSAKKQAASAEPGNQPSSDEVASDPASGDQELQSNSTPSLRGQLDDSNSLITIREQRAVLINLVSPGLVPMPSSLNHGALARQPPPEYFTISRLGRSSGSQSNISNPNANTTTISSIKAIGTKFQCLNENLFIVAITIPIRLDVSSYSSRTSKFECHLKFTTKTAAPVSGVSPVPNFPETSGQAEPTDAIGSGNSSLLMDAIDETLQISFSRDKDCIVRLKKPILIRMGNINEIILTLQTYALDDDVVALQATKSRLVNFSEQTDAENINWLFFKTSHLEFSELHYYY